MGPKPFPSPESAETEVVRALRAGDEPTFLALVKEHHPAMLRVAEGFTGDRAVAEEVVQESWLGVLEGLAGFEGRSSLRTWLFTIVANCARSRARREARSTPLSAFDEAVEPAVDPARFLPEDHPRWPGHWSSPPEEWAEAKLLTREALGFVAIAIAALPAAQRQVIVLRDVEGCTAAEACVLLELSEGNQRVLLHRARSKVRASLEKALGGGR